MTITGKTLADYIQQPRLGFYNILVAADGAPASLEDWQKGALIQPYHDISRQLGIMPYVDNETFKLDPMAYLKPLDDAIRSGLDPTRTITFTDSSGMTRDYYLPPGYEDLAMKVFDYLDGHLDPSWQNDMQAAGLSWKLYWSNAGREFLEWLQQEEANKPQKIIDDIREKLDELSDVLQAMA